MKLKILRTIILYLGILIISYSIYLAKGFADGFCCFGCTLIASIVYLWIEYSDFEKQN